MAIRLLSVSDIDAARWPEHVRLSDLEPKFTVRLAAIMAPISDRYFKTPVSSRSDTFTAGMHPLGYRISHGAHTENVML